MSLSDQLDLFKEYVKKIKLGAGEKKASNIVTKSLYIVVCGSDDIANTYYSTPFRRGEYDIPAYTDLMVNSASSFIQVSLGRGTFLSARQQQRNTERHNIGLELQNKTDSEVPVNDLTGALWIRSKKNWSPESTTDWMCALTENP